MHPFNKTIYKYNIGKGATLKFKGDPNTYYFEKFNPNGYSIFCKINHHSSVFNKHTKNLEKINGRIISTEDVGNLLTMNKKLEEFKRMQILAGLQ